MVQEKPKYEEKAPMYWCKKCKRYVRAIRATDINRSALICWSCKTEVYLHNN